MFERGTVFIIGAGASVDLNLPAGKDLRSHIARILRIDPQSRRRFADEQIYDAVVSIVRKSGPNDAESEFAKYIEAAQSILAALPIAQSIDNLLHTHRDNPYIEQMGKLAIAKAILQAEAKSHLANKRLSHSDVIPTDSYWKTGKYDSKLLESWYFPLIQLLNSGVSVRDLPSIFENVSFIVFNYDRCLEYFLVNALIVYYRIDTPEAVAIIRTLKIIHPYGQVGNLPWQGDESTAAFGSESVNLVEIAGQLKTFTESTTSGVAEAVKSQVAAAETLVVMGFGFLPQNVRLCQTVTTKIKRVFVTTTGINDADIPVVRRELFSMLARPRLGTTPMVLRESDRFEQFIERGTCADLMNNHWLQLTRPS